jgi:hypothetical protein
MACSPAFSHYGINIHILCNTLSGLARAGVVGERKAKKPRGALMLCAYYCMFALLSGGEFAAYGYLLDSR